MNEELIKIYKYATKKRFVYENRCANDLSDGNDHQ